MQLTALFQWLSFSYLNVKWKDIHCNPDFAGVQSNLKFHYNSETFACDFSQQEKFLSKWKPMKKLFCQKINAILCNIKMLV